MNGDVNEKILPGDVRPECGMFPAGPCGAFPGVLQQSDPSTHGKDGALHQTPEGRVATVITIGFDSVIGPRGRSNLRDFGPGPVSSRQVNFSPGLLCSMRSISHQLRQDACANLGSPRGMISIGRLKNRFSFLLDARFLQRETGPHY